MYEEINGIEDTNVNNSSSPSSAQQLRKFLERIERLENEKNEISTDIKEVYKEVQAMGFKPKIMRKIVSMRKKDPHQREEEASVLETYLIALGMVDEDN